MMGQRQDSNPGLFLEFICLTSLLISKRLNDLSKIIWLLSTNFDSYFFSYYIINISIHKFPSKILYMEQHSLCREERFHCFYFQITQNGL